MFFNIDTAQHMEKIMHHTSFTEKDWDDYARCYDGLNKLRPYQALHRAVSAALWTGRSKRILDAACGTGNLIALLAKQAERKNTFLDIYGVDFSEAMLKLAKEKCVDNARFQHADLNEKLPFENGFFDTVVSINTLYALRDPLRTLREFARLLATNGRLILVTPIAGYQNGLILKAHSRSTEPDYYWRDMHASAEREMKLIKRACGDTKEADMLIAIGKFNREINREGAFHFFTKEELSNVALQAGFQVQMHTRAYARQCHMVILRLSK